ncbi:amino acid adenylation domain-containing protein [Salinactinospora qingdaonensis]|uniref:Amino acid adenylation domain-containing protein n=1 Tax=Salinactinospora qingdaonensis TaxID=702744 RepID=A0ABP7GA23_9ACTN
MKISQEDLPYRDYALSHSLFPGSRLEEIFEARAEEHPERDAVTTPDGSMTYRELDSRATVVARRLTGHGVGPDVVIALYTDRSVEMLVGLLGILKAGGAYLPVDSTAPAARVRWLLEDSGASAVVTVSRLAATLGDWAGKRVLVDGEAAEDGAPAPEPSMPRAATDLAYVIYTSGSTGTPKGVLVEHRNIVGLFEQTRQQFDFGPDDVWTMFHSVAFDFSVWEIWGALLHGGRLVIVPDEVCRAPARFRSLLTEQGVTVVNQTPSALRQLIGAEVAADDIGGPRLRWVILGGERLDPGMLEPWIARRGDEQPRLVNMYGITETTVHASFRRITREDVDRRGVSPIGVALPGLEFLVLRESGEATDTGEAGELYISGTGVARGYLNRAQLTAERFVYPSQADGRRCYRTGDLVARDDSGEYRYLGRVDDQLKVRGFRIEPGEVEAALNTHPGVATSVVTAWDYGEGDVRLVAYLVPAGEPVEAAWGQQGPVDALTALPSHMHPSAFVTLRSLPMTANGKVDRNALPDPRQSGDGTEGSGLSAVQAEIAAIWRQVLGVAEVDLDGDFFDLGGTSLTLVRMFDRVNAHFNTDLDISVLVDEATVRSLAANFE